MNKFKNLNQMIFNNSLIINLFFFDPLEQFDIFQISFFNTNLIYFFILLIIFNNFFLHFQLNFIKKDLFLFNLLVFQIFNFTKNLINTNILLSKQFFLVFYYFIFLFILFSNIFGLIPYSFTITSAFIITFSIALIILYVINILAIYINGFFRFIGFFLPSGTPLMIALLLVFIEIISYIARLFSLSIRLFANMMAGHTLLKILIGFSFTILFLFNLFSIFAIFP